MHVCFKDKRIREFLKFQCYVCSSIWYMTHSEPDDFRWENLMTHNATCCHTWDCREKFQWKCRKKVRTKINFQNNIIWLNSSLVPSTLAIVYWYYSYFHAENCSYCLHTLPTLLSTQRYWLNYVQYSSWPSQI
jgi:hypothetical protein